MEDGADGHDFSVVGWEEGGAQETGENGGADDVVVEERVCSVGVG